MKANYEEDKVIVSATEPTGVNRKKVWFKKGKNLIKEIILDSSYNENETSILYNQPNFARTDFIQIEHNVDYIFSHSLGTGNGYIIMFDKNFDYIGGINHETITTKFNITNVNVKYIMIVIWSTTINTDTNIMLEQNTVATTYEAYVEPEIYILNSNNVYEKFEKNEGKETILFKGSIKFGNNVCVIPDNIRYVEVYFKIGFNKNSIRIDTSYTPTSTEFIGTFIACTGTIFAEVEMNFKANRYLKADYIATYANLNSDAVNKNNTDGFEVYKVVGYK